MTDDRLLMHALADDELSAEERKNAEDHLAGCPQCRAEYTAVDSMKTVLKTRLEPIDVEASWARCRKRLNEIDRASAVQAFVTRYAWGFCSLFLVIILSAATLNHVLGRRSVQTGDFPYISSDLMPMPGPPSRNPRAIQNWMSQAVGDVAPVNLRPRVVQVLGGASGSHDGHRVSRLDIRDRTGLMHLFVISDVQAIDGLQKLESSPDYYVGKIGTMNCVAWTVRDSALLIMGDREIKDLCAVADEIGVK